jgi:hypothetical protein
MTDKVEHSVAELERQFDLAVDVSLKAQRVTWELSDRLFRARVIQYTEILESRGIKIGSVVSVDGVKAGFNGFKDRSLGNKPQMTFLALRKDGTVGRVSKFVYGARLNNIDLVEEVP